MFREKGVQQFSIGIRLFPRQPLRTRPSKPPQGLQDNRIGPDLNRSAAEDAVLADKNQGRFRLAPTLQNPQESRFQSLRPGFAPGCNKRGLPCLDRLREKAQPLIKPAAKYRREPQDNGHSGKQGYRLWKHQSQDVTQHPEQTAHCQYQYGFSQANKDDLPRIEDSVRCDRQTGSGVESKDQKRLKTRVTRSSRNNIQSHEKNYRHRCAAHCDEPDLEFHPLYARRPACVFVAFIRNESPKQQRTDCVSVESPSPQTTRDR